MYTCIYLYIYTYGYMYLFQATELGDDISPKP